MPISQTPSQLLDPPQWSLGSLSDFLLPQEQPQQQPQQPQQPQQHDWPVVTPTPAHDNVSVQLDAAHTLATFSLTQDDADNSSAASIQVRDLNAAHDKVDYPELLCKAAARGQSRLVKDLILNAKNRSVRTGRRFDIDGKGVAGNTPLFYAARHGRIGLCRLLVRHSADPNARCSFGRSPIHAAAGNMKIFKALESHGARIDVSDDDGCSALFYAAAAGDAEMVKYLLVRGVGARGSSGMLSEPYAIHEASRRGYRNTVRLLIESGGDVNATDRHGQTPLIIACIRPTENMFDLIKQLIEGHKARFNLRDKVGRTALFYAFYNGLHGITSYLRQQGAIG